MGDGDRERWDRRWSEGAHGDTEAPDWLAGAGLPLRGRALDVAAGAGRVALWLARRGLEVVAVDVSSVALDRLADRASEDGLRVETCVRDLELEPLPRGPFDAITCFHYLQRDLFPALGAALAPGGLLCVEIATVRNLERHARPSRRFLLEEGELAGLLAPLERLHLEEGWIGERALARAVVRRSPSARRPSARRPSARVGDA